MRNINVKVISDTIEEMCITANKTLPSDIVESIKAFNKKESNDVALSVFSDMKENIDVAKKLSLPVCQDTGMAVVFLEIGQDVHFTDGDLYNAVNEGVKNGYEKGLLRKSVVADPLKRVNTNDNTPAIIHTKIVSGEMVKITVVPKGFGSENMSALKMMMPSNTKEDVINFVIDTVKNASSNPCPPIVVGIGIGGDFEQCAILSKMALIRPLNERNKDEFYADMETELLKRINKLGIGPQGFGGDTTALGVNIETAPTHIAGLPVAVNIGCHVTRHISKEV